MIDIFGWETDVDVEISEGEDLDSRIYFFTTKNIYTVLKHKGTMEKMLEYFVGCNQLLVSVLIKTGWCCCDPFDDA
jgi:hypothetical protein